MVGAVNTTDLRYVGQYDEITSSWNTSLGYRPCDIQQTRIIAELGACGRKIYTTSCIEVVKDFIHDRVYPPLKFSLRVPARCPFSCNLSLQQLVGPVQVRQLLLNACYLL